MAVAFWVMAGHPPAWAAGIATSCASRPPPGRRRAPATPRTRIRARDGRLVTRRSNQRVVSSRQVRSRLICRGAPLALVGRKLLLRLDEVVDEDAAAARHQPLVRV